MTPASRAKPTVLQAFETNLADARHLGGIAQAMTSVHDG